LLFYSVQEEETMNQNPLHADPTDRVMKIPPVKSPSHEEALLDQAVAESFPASDPISPAMPSRLEPGDTRRDEAFTNEGTTMSERMRRNAPALVAIGTAAVALLAIRALRGNRRRARDDDYDYDSE